MKNKTAILIGATGLVGSHVLKELQDRIEIGQVLIFGRRPAGANSGKVREYLIDFDRIEDYADLIRGDVLFSCLGTTLKAAGSKETQTKVDVTYQDKFAKIAADNKIPAYYLVSAPGADKKSMFFYSRIKGELEDRILKYDFDRIRFFRPSILTGSRDEERKGEKWTAWIMNNIGRYLPLVNQYKPISGATVAKAMVNEYLNNTPESFKIYELNEIYDLVEPQQS